MTYSSDSKEVILDVRHFSLAYTTPFYKVDSFRDYFVNFFKSPMNFLLNSSQKVLILDDINLQVKKGDRVGILGNNGSGKTSLCRFICGLFGPVQSIRVNGLVRGIFDTEVVVLPELSGRENLEVLAHFFFPEIDTETRKKIIKESEEFSELGKYLDVPFKLYSKGMRARLFLSLISSRPSDLLILDEVFNGADHFFSDKITQRIKKLIHESGAVIFVSHSHDLINEVCNRVIVFDNKKVVFDGPAAEGIHYYRTHCERTLINND